MYALYSALLAAGLVLSLPFWLWKMATVGKYRAGLAERLGRVPARLRRGGGPALWVHAVSVGEVLAIAPLVERWQATHPEWEVFVSTTTMTGQRLARQRFGEDRVFYFPLDLGFAIGPWLRWMRPTLVVMAEAEFWPNFLRRARRAGAKVAVVNARISDRSLPGYVRWKRLLAPVLADVDLFLAQSATDAQRLVEIGAGTERVQASGNLKFDARPPQASAFADELRARLAEAEAGPVMVCGSTTDAPEDDRAEIAAEEPVLLSAFKAVLEKFPGAVMILAPRLPERFAAVAEMLAESGVPWWRRSQWPPSAPLRGGVLLLDSIGELASVYGVGTLAFVGGSLVARGGHNILEPAHFGVPVCVGFHTENFRDIVNHFVAARAVTEIDLDVGEDGSWLHELVAAEWVGLLRDPDSRAMGERGRAVLEQQRGATGRTLTALEGLVGA